ncbi:MAG: DUF5335 family protein [Aeromicrobium sp.]
MEQRDEVPREEWSGFFEGVIKEHAGQDVTIELLDRTFGDGLEAGRLPLAYVEYAPKDDEVSVAVGGRSGQYPVVLRHAVHGPRRISSDRAAPLIDWVFDILGDDDSHTIVTILARPEPGAD